MTSVTHILMTIGCLDIGGAERRLLQLVRALHARNVPVRLSFFVISGRAGRLEEDFRSAGCRIFHSRTGLAGMFDLTSLCRRIKPDVLHANSGTAAGFYCMAARTAGVPRTISHIRSTGPVRMSGTGKRGLIYERMTGLASDLVVGVSEAALQGKKFGRVPKQVIYNGLDPAELAAAERPSLPRGFGGEGPDFVILGRLSRIKNIPHAITAFARFAESRGHMAGRLHVVGPDGNVTAAELKNYAQKSGIADRVMFHGPTSEPMRFFINADCALITSDYEGLPGVALEALACGTPLVASDILPSREVARLTEGMDVVSVSNLNGWVIAMSRALERDRAAIRNFFWQRSPFTLDRHVTEILEAWGVDVGGSKP